MRFNLLGLCILALFAGKADAQIPARPQCNEDCLTILKEGVTWFLEDHAYVPNQIVLDTTASGVLRQNRERVRFIDRTILSTLANDLGMQRDVRARVMACTDSDAGPQCRMRRGSILMSVYPPKVRPGRSGEVEFEIRVTGRLKDTIPWGSRTFLLTLEHDGQRWFVVGAKLIMVG